MRFPKRNPSTKDAQSIFKNYFNLKAIFTKRGSVADSVMKERVALAFRLGLTALKDDWFAVVNYLCWKIFFGFSNALA
jgi:hypothetical protein